MLDEVKERGGLKNPDGVNQYSEVKASTDALTGKSAKTTAKKAGTSQAKVEKVRAIKKEKGGDHKSDEFKKSKVQLNFLI